MANFIGFLFLALILIVILVDLIRIRFKFKEIKKKFSLIILKLVLFLLECFSFTLGFFLFKCGLNMAQSICADCTLLEIQIVFWAVGSILMLIGLTGYIFLIVIKNMKEIRFS